MQLCRKGGEYEVVPTRLVRGVQSDQLDFCVGWNFELRPAGKDVWRVSRWRGFDSKITPRLWQWVFSAANEQSC